MSLGRSGSVGDGDGFAVEAEDLREFEQHWEDLASDYQQDMQQMNFIKTTIGAGLEYASRNNAEQVKAFGETLGMSLQGRRDYCLAQAKKYRDAFNSYSNQEDASIRAIQILGHGKN
jgi:hypothetical protein